MRASAFSSSCTCASTCFDVVRMLVEAAEERERLADGELVGKLRLLERDADPLSQRLRVALPRAAEHLDLAGVTVDQPLADLDGRGLAGAVRAEQAEALLRADVEVDAVDRHDVAVRLPEVANDERDVSLGLQDCMTREVARSGERSRMLSRSGARNPKATPSVSNAHAGLHDEERLPMMVLLPIAIAFQVQVGVTVGSDSAQKAREKLQRAEVEAEFEAGAPPRRPQTFHRIPLTDALRASAFKDPAARDLLLRARAARLRQDSALASYDATTYQRVSVGTRLQGIRPRPARDARRGVVARAVGEGAGRPGGREGEPRRRADRRAGRQRTAAAAAAATA